MINKQFIKPFKISIGLCLKQDIMFNHLYESIYLPLENEMEESSHQHYHIVVEFNAYLKMVRVARLISLFCFDGVINYEKRECNCSSIQVDSLNKVRNKVLSVD